MTKFAKYIAALALFATLCWTATAQPYSVRVKHNTNIRANPSLDAARLETVPAGATLEVLEQFNNWLKVNRHGGAWMAAWVAHKRVETVQPVTDNCCGIDRQCQREQEWIDGYWAYQRGQCGAPAQLGANEGLHCNHHHELKDGYWRFLGGSCTTPANASHARIRITEKTAGFADLVNRGFELLKSKAPEWYTYSILWTNEVREVHSWAETGAFSGGLSSYHHAPHYIRPIIPEDDVTMAEFLVHEACHHNQKGEGRGHYGLNIEYECAQKQLVAAYLVGPVQHHIDQLEYFIANPQDQSVWWWEF